MRIVSDDEVSASAKNLHWRALRSSVRAGRQGRIVDADLVDLDMLDAVALMELQMLGWWHRQAGAYVVHLETGPLPHHHPLSDLVDRWAYCTTCGALVPPPGWSPSSVWR